MALPQLIANSNIPGEVTSLGTVTKELKTGETTLEVSAKPPATLEASGQFTIVVGQEIMLVTGGQTTTKWTVTRKSESPSAEANHPVGTEVFHFFTAESLKAFLEEIVTPVTIKPTNNPTSALTVNPTNSTSEVNASTIKCKPTYTGTGNGPQGIIAQPIFQPSANITIAYGGLQISRGEPPIGVKINVLVGGYYRCDTGSSEGTVTETQALRVEVPTFGSIKPTTAVGTKIFNQGAIGVTTAVGVDVETQKSATTSIGVRIAKGETYALQLSDTGGTTAGGIEFGTDTNLRRSAAKVLKVETILDAETGFRVNGAATAGQYLRGNGTNFISETIKTEDLPAPTAKPTKAAEKAITVGAASPAKKVGFTLTGDNAKTAWKVKHALETRLIQIAIQKASAEEPEEGMLNAAGAGNFTWKAISASEVEIIFGTAPGAGVQIFGTVIG